MKTKLRKWKMEDAQQLSEMLNNQKILANLRDGLSFPYTIDDAKEYIKAMLDADQDQTFDMPSPMRSGSLAALVCSAKITSIFKPLNWVITLPNPIGDRDMEPGR